VASSPTAMPRSSTSKKSAVLRTLASPVRAAASQHGQTAPVRSSPRATTQSSSTLLELAPFGRREEPLPYGGREDREVESCGGALLPSQGCEAPLRLIIQASRSPGAKARTSSAVASSNRSLQAARRQAARR